MRKHNPTRPQRNFFPGGWRAAAQLPLPREPFRSLNAGIKPHVLFLATLVLGLASGSAAEFKKSLSNAEMQSAGLAKLTPEELMPPGATG